VDGPPVAGLQLGGTLDAVAFLEQVPGSGQRQRGEAAAYHAVVRVVNLEKDGSPIARTPKLRPPPGHQKLTSLSVGRSVRNRYRSPSVTPTYAFTTGSRHQPGASAGTLLCVHRGPLDEASDGRINLAG